MNERIKELLLQAISQSFNRIDRDGDMDKMYIPNVFAEEFAELIVRECINVIGESRESRQTAMYYRHRIAEHFRIL